MKYTHILYAFLISILLVSCESEVEKNNRLGQEAEQKKYEAARLEKVKIDTQKRAEQEKAQREVEEENKRKEKELYEKFINNSLPIGSTPYLECYGGNPSCNSYGCSEIVVRTSNSDVLVTIKSRDKVVRQNFIKTNSFYKISMPNGTYQPFFYYGKGWNPEKEMKNGELRGGFISNEVHGKDDPAMKPLWSTIKKHPTADLVLF